MFNDFIEIINVLSMLHRCRIVIFLMNRPVFSIRISMNHQNYQCVLDWGLDYDLMIKSIRSELVVAEIPTEITIVF